MAFALCFGRKPLNPGLLGLFFFLSLLCGLSFFSTQLFSKLTSQQANSFTTATSQSPIIMNRDYEKRLLRAINVQQDDVSKEIVTVSKEFIRGLIGFCVAFLIVVFTFFFCCLQFCSLIHHLSHHREVQYHRNVIAIDSHQFENLPTGIFGLT